MSTAAFALGLSGLGVRTRLKRAKSFLELTLAEADDLIDASAHAVDAIVAINWTAEPTLLVAEAHDAKPVEDLLLKVGRGRTAPFGGPRWGHDHVRPWGEVSGKPRYRYVSCGRHSTRWPGSRWRTCITRIAGLTRR